jgi:thiol-disulfide isomerase/thioredoxin
MQSYTANTASSMNGGSMQEMASRAAQIALDYKFIILGIIGFSILGYLIYDQFINKNTVFNANREQGTSDPNSNKTAEMMLFYVDWCPHCKTAKPEWENLKSEYEGKQINGYNLKFTEYNCTAESAENDELMNKYKIEGYPTIKLLKGDQVIEYDAKPTKSTMEQFLHTVL